MVTGLERRKKETVRRDRFPAVGFSPLCSYEPTLQARTKYSKEEGMSPRHLRLRQDLKGGKRKRSGETVSPPLGLVRSVAMNRRYRRGLSILEKKVCHLDIHDYDRT
jgi:hypothetical protein